VPEDELILGTDSDNESLTSDAGNAKGEGANDNQTATLTRPNDQ
jgi:hypothetical protein